MAKNTTKPEPEEVLEVQTPEEPEYTVAEFAMNATHLFGGRANADIVHAAFLVEGRGKATLSEAKEIVAGFMKKEVK